MKQLSQTVFLKYYLRYYEKIYRYLYFRAYEDKALAEDLTSETFLKAFEKFETFDPEKNFSSWIYAIARNCLIDHFRKEKRHKEVSLSDYENFLKTDSEEVQEAVDQKLIRKKILELLELLPQKEKELLLLKYFDQLENKEIVRILDINPATLRVQQHRALKKIKKLLPSAFFIFFLIIISIQK